MRAVSPLALYRMLLDEIVRRINAKHLQFWLVSDTFQ